MLDALIDRKNGDIAGVGEAPLVNDPAEALEHRGRTVAERVDAVDVVGAGRG